MRTPAKINLFLRVIGKRPDGYHDLCSLMCPVALYDILTFSFGGIGGVRVGCDHPDVPEDSSNLVAKAAALFFESAFDGTPPGGGGLHIRIDKQIPVGAGLGGGSSDAAAALTTLNRHFGYPLAQAELMRLGTRIGADVPFFIHGVPAVATGIGDSLTAYPHLTPWAVLLVYPGVVVSTAWVYNNLNLRLTKGEKKLNKSDFNGRIFRLDEDLANDLEPVTEKAFPVIGTIKRLLRKQGAAAAMMSGSGSTVFGLFQNSERAQSACTALRGNRQSRNWALYVVDLLI